MRSIKSIEDRASGLLTDVGIITPKVSLTRIADYLNLHLIERELDDSISGMLSVNNGINAIICNSKHIEGRRRFTIAHEIGHFILHQYSKDTFLDSKETQVLYRKDSTSGQNWKQEYEANAFAAALLMPKSMLEKKLESIKINYVDDDVLIQLADEFGVSQIAMSFRITNLGIFH